MPKQRPIKIDGSHLEGGGQIPRMAVALSALTSTPVHITRIRANRTPSGKGIGGLKGQHAVAIGFLAEYCGATTQGLVIGSEELVFTPGVKKELPSRINIELQTPGAITLVLQTLLPYLFFHPRADGREYEVRITGGTHVSGSPTTSYFVHVTLPVLELMGLTRVEIISERACFGGKSLGELVLRIPALKAGQTISGAGFDERGDIREVGWMFLSPVDGMLDDFEACMQRHWPDHAVVRLDDAWMEGKSQRNSGWYLLIVIRTTTGHAFGADGIIETKNLPLTKTQANGRDPLNAVSRQVVAECMVRKVSTELQATWSKGRNLDPNMEDQVVIFQALSSMRGRIDTSLSKTGEPASDLELVEDEHGNTKMIESRRDKNTSLHTLTARWVASTVTSARFDEEGRCSGIAFAGATS